MNKTLTTALALCASLSLCGDAHGDYLAYAVGEKSRVPLPQAIDAIDARYLVNIEWGDYDGGPSRVAVLPVDNNSPSGSFSVVGPGGQSVTWSNENAGMVPVNGIEAIVTDVMNRTGRFRLIERQLLDSILQERDFGASGPCRSCSS